MSTQDDDDTLVALFDGVNPRPEPTEQSSERAFAAVEAEWSELQARRRRRSYQRVFAVAATFVFCVMGVLLWLQPNTTEISVQLAHGTVLMGDGKDQRTIDTPQGLLLGPGTAITSANTSRWVLNDSIDVRLAADTSVRWIAPHEIELVRGNIYIATDGRNSFTVQTDYGRVTDIGTRFMVIAEASGVEVAVREGVIELASEHGQHRSGPAGDTESSVIRVTSDGVDESSEVRSSERWSWIHQAPSGYTSNEPLVLLKQIAKDLGKRIEYRSLGVEASLGTERIDGDFSGMAPLQALRLLAETIGLEWQVDGVVITVDFKQ